jgi:hypothetical protein
MDYQALSGLENDKVLQRFQEAGIPVSSWEKILTLHIN